MCWPNTLCTFVGQCILVIQLFLFFCWPNSPFLCTVSNFKGGPIHALQIPKELRDACTAVVPRFFHVARNISELKASEQAFRIEQRVHDPWWNLWQYI